jgi:hypothetical protein
MLTVQHRARNNLHADLTTGLKSLLGQVPQAFEAQPASAAA